MTRIREEKNYFVETWRTSCLSSLPCRLGENLFRMFLSHVSILMCYIDTENLSVCLSVCPLRSGIV